ncbi:phosphocholine cytidylyltransferase family protein [Amycolatopsis sp.]|uniref:phosphocholine cytidylyltransferase family protein n=1 Tax=Amycolatopsis sp. TaxID=37632 RepID=UPI002B976A09|nr:phosphocholine cytidylyltransferase family protein [Amycolatopsis sp.]HVV13128.1 phosphocholine cytidylyltransferase family protein [Amycolatopsis sp.]
MRAVILSAGRGSRMGSRTDDRPKALLELAGRSLLDRQVAALRQAGVEDVAVVTGWQAEAFADLPLRRFHNPDWASSTMVGSLACADDWLSSGPVLVSYGDIVFGPATARALARHPGDLVVAYDPAWLTQWSARFGNPLADAESFRLAPAGLVREIGGTPGSVAEIEGQYLGLLKFEPPGWQALLSALQTAIRLNTRQDTTGLLQDLITQGGLVHAVPTESPWHEFDHPTDIAAGTEVLKTLDRTLFVPPP